MASSPVPLDMGTTRYEFVDLMWLEGYQAISSDIYFGTTEAAVKAADPGSPEFMGNQSSNIYDLGPLQASQTCYWRIDAVKDGETVTGEVWSFIAGIDANPPVYKASFQVSGSKEGEVLPLHSAVIRMEGRKRLTDEKGVVTLTMLKEGMYVYHISQYGYVGITDSVYISSDTILTSRSVYPSSRNFCER